MIIREGRLRDALRLIVWFPGRWIIGILPIDVAFLCFKLMGDLHFCFGTGKRKALQKNMRALLKLDENKKVSSVVKRHLEQHYLDRLHIFLYPRLNRDNIRKYVSIEGEENLRAEMKQGKGCILVQPHFGPVQISLLTLSLLGYDLVQIGFPTDEGLSQIGKSVAYKYRLKYECMLPAPIISADRYMGVIFKQLKKNALVMTTGDGIGGDKMLGRHVEMDFLGTKRMIPLGPASLSIRSGASLLPTFIIVKGFNRFQLKIEKALRLEHGRDDREEMEKELMRKFVVLAERYIKEYPAGYHFWDELTLRKIA